MNRSRRLLFRAVTVVASSLLAIVVIEFALRFYHPGDRSVITYVIQRNSGYFSRVLDDRSPLFYTYSGIETNNPDEIKVRYPDDKLRAFLLRKRPNAFRVVAVGDSITELWNLPGFANYTTFLERALNEKLHASDSEVIPLGVGGYNTWQEMNFYRQCFSSLQTDVFLLQCCPNDADVMSLRARPAGQAVPANEWPGFEIVGQRFGRPDFDRFKIGPFQSRVWWLITQRGVRRHELDGLVQVTGNDEQHQAIEWFRDFTRGQHVPLLAVLFPMLVDGYSQPELKHLQSELDACEVPYLDLLPEFQKAGSLKSLGRDSYHPNDKGHQVAAQAIARYLEAHDLLNRKTQ